MSHSRPPHSTSTVAPRPTHQRGGYVVTGPSERFIVPLLAERIPALLATWCQRTGPGSALDAGCGLQPFRQLLEDAGYAYKSCDVVQNRLGTVDFVTPLDGPLPPALVAAGPFDLILCTEVLEHVAHWEGTFKNLSALLAAGGKVLVTAPHFYPLHEVPYDFWRPTPFAIEEFARGAGLNVVHLERAGGAWEVLGTLLAESRFYPQQPGLMPKLLTILAKAVRKGVERATWSARFRGMVEFRGPHFLSCLAILEKPAA